MINTASEGSLEEEFKDNQEEMSHYDVMIKNLTEENRRLQNEIQLLHRQNCYLTNRLKILTEEKRAFQ